MAIAFDALTKAAAYPNPFTHTLSAQSNRVLWVSVVNALGEGTPVGVTVGGLAMTLVATQDHANQAKRMTLWKKLAPATGAQSIQIDPTGLSGWNANATSYIGCHPTLQPDSQHKTANTGGDALTWTDSTVVGAPGAWLFMAAYQGTGNYSGGTGTTIRSAAGDSPGIFDSNGQVALGSQSLQAVTSVAGQWCSIIVSMTPAAAFGMFV